MQPFPPDQDQQARMPLKSSFSCSSSSFSNELEKSRNSGILRRVSCISAPAESHQRVAGQALLCKPSESLGNMVARLQLLILAEPLAKEHRGSSAKGGREFNAMLRFSGAG